MKTATVNYLKNLSEQQSKYGNPFSVKGKLIEKDIAVKEIVKNQRGKLVAVIELEDEKTVQIQLHNQLVDPAKVKKVTIQEFELEKDLVIKNKITGVEELIIAMDDKDGRNVKPFALTA